MTKLRDGGKNNTLEPHFFGSFDIFWDIIYIKTLFWSTTSTREGFKKDPAIRFEATLFKGEDFVIEQTKNGIVSVDSIEMAFRGVGKKNELNPFLFELFDNWPKGCIGGEYTGRGIDQLVQGKEVGRASLEKTVDSGTIE